MVSAVAGQCGLTLISRRGGLLLSSSSSTYSNGGMKLELRVRLAMQGSAMTIAPQLILAMAPKKKVLLLSSKVGLDWLRFICLVSFCAFGVTVRPLSLSFLM